MSQTANPDSPTQPILVPVDFEPAARPNYYQRHGEQDAVLPMMVVAERRLKKFLMDVYRDNPALRVLETPDILLVEGLPSTRIPEVAGRIAAGQIVMGHQKARGVFPNLFASLSERVADSCSVPVTVIYSNGKPEVAAMPPRKLMDDNVVLGA